VTQPRRRPGSPVSGPLAKTRLVADARNLINTPEQLRQRMACNGSASADFNQFVLGLLAPSGSDVALDIGPGVGKQMVLLAGVARRIVGLDCSPEMAAAVCAGVSGSPTVEVGLESGHPGNAPAGLTAGPGRRAGNRLWTA